MSWNNVVLLKKSLSCVGYNNAPKAPNPKSNAHLTHADTCQATTPLDIDDSFLKHQKFTLTLTLSLRLHLG